MRRLRIAYLSDGTLVHVAAYIRFFLERGHEVHWITYASPPETYGAILHDVGRGIDPFGSRLSKWRYLRAVPRIRTILRQIRPDVLHGHYVTAAGVLCRVSGFRPYILSIRGSDLVLSMDSPAWRTVLRWAFRPAALVHAVSRPLADAARRLGVTEDRLLVLTQGVDLAALPFAPAPATGGPIRIISTRNLRPAYDPLTIVEACRILRDRGVDFRMTFAGRGPMQAQLEARVRAGGLADRIEFLNGFDSSRVAEVLHGNHLYVSASLWDGTSISLLEAMACGVFPVVSDIPANREWVQDGRTGLLFRIGHAEELAAAVERALANPLLRHEALRLNRRAVEDRADRGRNMLRLEEIYLAMAPKSA